jgi:hypothetical protein
MVPCVDHILNLICQDILSYMKATISTGELLDITIDTEEIIEEDSNTLPESSLTIISTTIPTTQSKRNSKPPPAKKVKKTLVKKSKTAPKGLNAFQKLRWIVGKIRLQQVLIIALVKEINERPFNERRKPTLDSPTRWNSTYKMIKDFLFQLNAISIVIARYPKYFENLELAPEDIKLVKSLGDILARIEALTILFEGSSYTSIQLVLPLMFNLDKFLNEVILDQHKSVTVKDLQLREACKQGLEKLRKYFNHREMSINNIEPWAIGIILDPRLKFTKFRLWGFSSSTITLLETRLKEIFNRYTILYQDLYPNHDSDNDLEIQDSSQQTRYNILTEMNEDIYGADNKPENELEAYLQSSEVASNVSLYL